MGSAKQSGGVLHPLSNEGTMTEKIDALFAPWDKPDSPGCRENKMLKLFILAAAAAMLAAIHNQPAEAAGEPPSLDLWPGQPPGETGSIGLEQDMTKPSDGFVGGRRVIRLGSVSRPTITLYRPNKAIDSGAAVLIAPGGGYQILAWDLEGTEIAEWLTSVGVTGIVLKYRVPRRPGDPADKPPVGPLQDAQRAMSLVRSRAQEWGIDPHRIGMLGFSAGGNLTVRTATLTDRAYAAVDATDRVSSRPDFMILVYPAYLAFGEGLANWLHVTKTPPQRSLSTPETTPPPLRRAVSGRISRSRRPAYPRNCTSTRPGATATGCARRTIWSPPGPRAASTGSAARGSSGTRGLPPLHRKGCVSLPVAAGGQ